MIYMTKATNTKVRLLSRRGTTINVTPSIYDYDVCDVFVMRWEEVGGVGVDLLWNRGI